MDFASSNLTITKDNPLDINSSSPSILNYGSITFEEGAEMQVYSEISLTAQTVSFLGNNSIKFIGKKGEAGVADAARGEDGGDSPNAIMNFGTVSGKADICILAGAGGDGAPGFPTGGNGGNGGNGGTVNITYQNLEANSGFTPVTPQAPKGKGGQGSKGVSGYDNGNDGLLGRAGQVIVQQA